MKITYKSDYALKTVLELALAYGREVVSSHDLADRIDAPVKFLEQVLTDLKKGGFVKSRRGKAGGYLLARMPREITVGEIVRLIEGPIEPIACVGACYTECGDMRTCVFRGIWQEVARVTADVVDNVTFEELVSRVGSRSKVLMYSI